MRRLWPGVLDKVKEVRRFTWIMLSQNAQVVALDGKVLTIGLVNSGARDSFTASGSGDILSQALQDVLGVAWTIEAVIDPSVPGAGASPDAAPSAAAPASSAPAKPRPAIPESVRRAAEAGTVVEEDDPDAAAHPDDPTVDAVDPEQLLAAELGAKVIDEKF